MEQNVNVEQTVEDFKKQVEASPEASAAVFLGQAIPAFKKQLNSVTGVQSKTILNALMSYHLEETPKFTTAEAKSVFNLGCAIQDSKFILFTASLKHPEVVESVNKQMVEELSNKDGE